MQRIKMLIKLATDLFPGQVMLHIIFGFLHIIHRQINFHTVTSG